MGDNKKRNWLRLAILVVLALILLLIPGDSARPAPETRPVATGKVPLGEKSGRIAVRTV